MGGGASRTASGLALALLLAVGSGAGLRAALQRAPAPPAAAACRLGHGIEHVVYLEFDNVHLARDRSGVPSDLEQMPHLLDFLTRNGTVVSSSHTALLAHTAGDLLTSLTGLYPDGHGQGVSNGWRYFRPDGGLGTGHSFTYWTSRVYDDRASQVGDSSYNLVTHDGRNTPAPWVPFTRAGCHVGSVAGPAGLALVNAADVAGIFGSRSPQAASARSDRRSLSELIGVAVHCAASSPLCSSERGGVPDLLPDEPGGYQGFRALFGHRYVVPLITAAGGLQSLTGRPIPTFPGFDQMTPAIALAYVAAMQEHGVPVTFAYLSDAHDPREGGRAWGPGEPDYVRQLHAYDAAFAAFFSRLQADGLDARNTLFVVAADEGDHFVGSDPEPAGCDGLRVGCRYTRTGQIRANLTGLLARLGMTVPLGLHADSAPAVWVPGDPEPSAVEMRALERAVAELVVTNPYTGAAEHLAAAVADRAELPLLHMTSGDRARVPSFVIFARPDYFVFAGGTDCPDPGCLAVDPQRAWSHGGVDSAVNTTWLALAGPGVARRGLDGRLWADEADIRPTVLALTGLRDSYRHDGRVLAELMEPWALPAGIVSSLPLYQELARSLKQIDAPVGALGLASLRSTTEAVVSDTPGDSAYLHHLERWRELTARRDRLVGSMLAQLEAVSFQGRVLDGRAVREDTTAAGALLAELAAGETATA